MPHDVTLWEVLHDGSIVGLAGSIPGDVTVTVDIEYIRELLPDPGDRFVIVLTGCTLLQCRDFVGDDVVTLTDLAAIAAAEPEILSVRAQEDRVVVHMNRGSSPYMELHLQYAGLTIHVDSGRVVPLDELVDAARRYWDAFAAKARASRQTKGQS